MVIPFEQAKDPAAVQLGSRGGLKGESARAKALSPERRKAIASNAATARWAKLLPKGLTPAQADQSAWKAEAAMYYSARRRVLLARQEVLSGRIARLSRLASALDQKLEELDHGARVFGIPAEGPP